MRNLAVVFAFNCNEYTEKKLPQNKTCIEYCNEYCTSLEMVDSCITVSDSKSKLVAAKLGFPVKIVENSYEAIATLLLELREGMQNIFLFSMHMPLLRSDLTHKLWNVHNQYFAEYSFSDGYPHGMVPEIINTEALSAVYKLAAGNKSQYSREGLFQIIQNDINSFDIETILPEKDYRMIRLETEVQDIRTFESVEAILSNDFKDHTELLEFAENSPAVRRTKPAYYAIQVSGKCLQQCSYCPYPLLNPGLLEDPNYMDFSSFKEVLDKISAFTPEAYISLGLWAEPSTNPDIYQMIEYAISISGFKIIVETSGLGWDLEAFEKVLSTQEMPALEFIVSVDSNDPSTYRELRSYGYDEAVGLINFLRMKIPGRVYAQAIRMKNSEDHMLDFFKYWEKQDGVTPLIQKYDTFAGFLEDRRLTDISPLDRMPCWHLQRDMYILLDGSVPMCREDLKKENLLGNIFADSIDEIWQKGHSLYKQHLEKKYGHFCMKCDEYYTFNF